VARLATWIHIVIALRLALRTLLASVLALLALFAPLAERPPARSALVLLGGDGLWLLRVDPAEEPELLGYGSYGSVDWRP
jgi:hypothetical protein